MTGTAFDSENDIPFWTKYYREHIGMNWASSPYMADSPNASLTFDRSVNERFAFIATVSFKFGKNLENVLLEREMAQYGDWPGPYALLQARFTVSWEGVSWERPISGKVEKNIKSSHKIFSNFERKYRSER